MPLLYVLVDMLDTFNEISDGFEDFVLMYLTNLFPFILWPMRGWFAFNYNFGCEESLSTGTCIYTCVSLNDAFGNRVPRLLTIGRLEMQQ